MPNVIELLNADHRRVEELFARFEATQERAVALQICDELTVHATVEEEIVYPVLQSIDRDLEQEAEQEHAEAKRLIARIRFLGAGDPSLSSTVQELQRAIRHHVTEEEGEAWAALRSGAGMRLDELGSAVEERKRQLTGASMPAPAPAPMTMPTTTPSFRPTEVRGTATADLGSMKKDELYQLAKERKLKGRSNMTKDELIRALSGSA